jgi:hypothetical protein
VIVVIYFAWNPKDHLMLREREHAIEATMFRSPEAMLHLRRGASTNVWSFDTSMSNPIGFGFLSPCQQTNNIICIVLICLQAHKHGVGPRLAHLQA